MRLADYEEKKKRDLPRWLRNLRDLFLIVGAFLGFAAFTVLVLPHAPKWVGYIVYPLGLIAVGSFVRGLAR
jgi:hypothetical protein